MQRHSLVRSYFWVVLLAITCLAASTVFSQQEAGMADEVQLKKIDVNGATLTYSEHGTGEPVIFVHGTLGDYRTWNGQIEAFSKKYHVISYSRRYHYPNPWPRDASSFSVTVHAKDLAAFIKELKVGKVHLVGHSFGAFISLLVARDSPELVRSLTLGEPPVWPIFETGSKGDSLVRLNATRSIISPREAFQNGNDIEGVRIFVNRVLGDGSFEGLPAEIRSTFMENARELKGATMDKNIFPPFSCEDAHNVSVPTLLLDGELSPRLFALAQNNLEKCLPNNERATIPAASHGLEYENPQAFNERVLAFIAQH